MFDWTPMIDVLPEGKSGIASVSHFEVTEDDHKFNFRGDVPPVGRYCRLHVGQTGFGPMMSDTPMEKRTNYSVVRNAGGEVLIAGLGLGMILLPILAKPEVTGVTVIERSADVVALVAPHLRDYLINHNRRNESFKLSVVESDIFDWAPPKGRKWDTIYFDIWPNICTDNLKDITRLKRKFCKRLNDGGWMGAWVERDLRSIARRERRHDRLWA